MQISRKSEYAIHSLMILAYNQETDMSVEELAAMQEVSQSYLAKVMQKMAGAGIVDSSKGFKGGYSLTIDPKEISLAQIVALFEPAEHFYHCLNKERDCQLNENCLIHKTFQQGYQAMLRQLEGVNIGDLLTNLAG